MKAWNHFCTITRHKILVMQGCFAVGLYWQGLMHDLSKYSPTEFRVGCKYYQGTRSPNNAEREILGYSSAWLHHKGRNKHHLEYWIDYTVSTDPKSGGRHGGIGGMKMPIRYVAEMFVDRVAASKNYQKEKYTQESALKYYLGGREAQILHEDSKAMLELLLVMLAEKGEEESNRFIRYELLKGKVVYEKAALDEMRRGLRPVLE